jgi:hypothetical protein
VGHLQQSSDLVVAVMIGQFKDAALSKALVMLLGPKIARYGEIKNFSLNTAGKQFTAEIQLRGEAEPLVISEAHYRLEQEREQKILVIYGLKVSRTWAQNVLEDHMPEIKLKVPEVVASLIK